MNDDTLRRFYGALVEALRERSPADLERPFTVAEIYQDLVPYRTHRDMLGVEMNGDYEHALLRLLAGEGGFLKIESDLAQREIQEELEEVDPNTTLYRDFAAVDVRLEPDAIPDFEDDVPGGAAATPVEEAFFGAGRAFSPSFATRRAGSGGVEVDASSTPASGSAGVDPSGGSEAEAADAESSPEPEEPSTDVGGPAPETDRQPSPKPLVARARRAPDKPVVLPAYVPEDRICRWCESELPLRDNLRYCPSCGADQMLTPCPSCGDALEPGWKFCISCGAAA